MHALHGRGQCCFVGASAQVPSLSNRVGLEIGQPVDGDLPVLVVENDGTPTSCQRVRMCTPARSASRALKPSRMGESWLPLVTTTFAREAASRASVSPASSIASTGGSARS